MSENGGFRGARVGKMKNEMDWTKQTPEITEHAGGFWGSQGTRMYST
jgi:hypothetical protein